MLWVPLQLEGNKSWCNRYRPAENQILVVVFCSGFTAGKFLLKREREVIEKLCNFLKI